MKLKERGNIKYTGRKILQQESQSYKEWCMLRKTAMELKTKRWLWATEIKEKKGLIPTLNV